MDYPENLAFPRMCYHLTVPGGKRFNSRQELLDAGEGWSLLPLPGQHPHDYGTVILSDVLIPENTAVITDDGPLPKVRMCSATTKAGNPCSRPALEDDTLCYIHRGAAQAEKE